jgi:hypothetical protein
MKAPTKEQIRAVMAEMGRRNRGGKKTMTKAAIAQRIAAARRSAAARRQARSQSAHPLVVRRLR